MATNTKTAQVVLSYAVDQASANRVRASFNNLENELGDLRSELNGISASADRGVSGLRTRFAAGETAVQSLQDEVEQLRSDLLRLDDVTVTPTVRVQQIGGGTTGGGIGGVLEQADRSGRTINQVLGGLGLGAAGGIADTIGDIAGAFTSLNPAMIALTAAGIGMAVVFGDIQKRMEEARQAATDYLARQADINLLLLQGDTQALEAKRDQLAQQIQSREDAASSIGALVQRFDELQLGADAILSGQEDLNTTGLAYTEILTEQEAIIQSLRDVTGNQNVTIGIAKESMASFAAETARLGTDLALTKSTLIEVAASIDAVTDKSVDFVNKTALALDNAIKASKDKGIGSGIQGGIGQGMTPFQDSQAQLNAALQTTRTDSYLSAVTKTIEAQQALTVAQNAYNDAVAASQQRISDINAKLQADLSQAETDRQNDLAEAARQAGEDRVKITEDAEKERARIQSRFEKASLAAIGERDALAAKRAEDQKDDELKQLGDRYKDQLKTVDDSLKKQNATIQARYDQQVRTINAAAQAAVRTEQQAAQARLNVLQQGIVAAQTQLVNAENGLALIRSNYYNQSIQAAQVWSNTLSLYTAAAFALPGGGGKIITPIPGKANGGGVEAGVPYVVGERGSEVFVPSVNGTIIPHNAGMTFNINLAGATTETIKVISRAQAIKAFNRILDFANVGAA